jgi:ADP-heptose:LPS heptosyltransferase
MTRPIDYARAGAAAISAMPRALAEIARVGRPGALVYFGLAPGDDLLCTPVLDALAATGTRPLWMMSNHPDLFRHNPSVAHVVPYDDGFAWALSLLGIRRLRLRYHDNDPIEDRAIAPPGHFIELMARRAGVEDAVRLAPRVYLDEAERAFGRFGDRQLAIQSSAQSARMKVGNKEWYPERFQEVVNALASEFTIVQLGLPSDPLLAGVVDLRGKTTLRQAAGVLHNSAAFIGLAGFLMHMAKAVGTRSAIVYGGRETPAASGYADNVNLFTALDCAPCWYWNYCPYERACMDRIQPPDVVAAVRSIVG